MTILCVRAWPERSWLAWLFWLVSTPCCWWWGLLSLLRRSVLLHLSPHLSVRLVWLVGSGDLETAVVVVVALVVVGMVGTASWSLSSSGIFSLYSLAASCIAEIFAARCRLPCLILWSLRSSSWVDRRLNSSWTNQQFLLVILSQVQHSAHYKGNIIIVNKDDFSADISKSSVSQ